MEMNLDKARRTEWSVKDRIWFFRKMRPLLNGIDDLDAEKIEMQLKDPDEEYLEIAAYLPGNKGDDPDAVLVFEKQKVYWDIFQDRGFSKIVKTVEQLTYPKARHIQTRRLTEEDWIARLQALSHDLQL